MTITYQDNQMIYQVDIRTHKNDSVFLYYTLEASGHLCFYTTQDFEECQQYRDVRIQAPIEMKTPIQEILQDLIQEITIDKRREVDILDQ